MPEPELTLPTDTKHRLTSESVDWARISHAGLQQLPVRAAYVRTL